MVRELEAVEQNWIVCLEAEFPVHRPAAFPLTLTGESNWEQTVNSPG